MSDKLFHYWTEIADQLLQKSYLPGLNETLKRASSDSWLLSRLKKRSDCVRGTRAHLLFMPQVGWGWRPVHPSRGVFPSGGKPTLGEMSFRLAMYGAGIQLSLEEIANLSPDNPESLIPLMDTKVQPVFQGFPSFLQVMVRTPQSGIVAVASANESSLAVAVDNAGLWNTASGDRVKWLEEGMFLQWYRGVREKVGGPVEIAYVDHDGNKVYLKESRAVLDNDFAVLTTIDGDEDMYYIAGEDGSDQEMSPGIYDVLDDDNTFQGVDRSQAANHWARATVVNRSGGVITKSTLRKFFRDTRATEAATAPEVVDYLFDQLFAGNIRYIDDRDRFKFGYDSVKFQNVRILAVPDGLKDSIDVVDFDDVCIATRGSIEDPHQQGWYPLPRSTTRCRDFAFWGRLIARKASRRNGRYHGFIISQAIA